MYLFLNKQGQDLPDIATLVADKAKRYRFDFRGRIDLNLMIATHTKSESENSGIVFEGRPTLSSTESNKAFLLSPKTMYDIYIISSKLSGDPARIGELTTRDTAVDPMGSPFIEGAEKISDNGPVDMFLENNYQLGYSVALESQYSLSIISFTMANMATGQIVASFGMSPSAGFFHNNSSGSRIIYIFVPAEEPFISGGILASRINGNAEILEIEAR